MPDQMDELPMGVPPYFGPPYPAPIPPPFRRPDCFEDYASGPRSELPSHRPPRRPASLGIRPRLSSSPSTRSRVSQARRSRRTLSPLDRSDAYLPPTRYPEYEPRVSRARPLPAESEMYSPHPRSSCRSCSRGRRTAAPTHKPESDGSESDESEIDESESDELEIDELESDESESDESESDGHSSVSDGKVTASSQTSVPTRRAYSDESGHSDVTYIRRGERSRSRVKMARSRDGERSSYHSSDHWDRGRGSAVFHHYGGPPVSRCRRCAVPRRNTDPVVCGSCGLRG